MFDWKTRNLTKKKTVYVLGETWQDLGLKKWRSKDFHIMLFIIVMTFWMRMYMHFFGQYVIIKIMQVPITKFNPSWHYV